MSIFQSIIREKYIIYQIFTDHTIDQMVYELYDLTEEEIMIVEK